MKRSTAAILAAAVMVASSAVASTSVFFPQRGILSVLLGEDVSAPSVDPAPLPIPEVISAPVGAPEGVVSEVLDEGTSAAAITQTAEQGGPLDPWKVAIASDGYLPGRVTAIADNYSRAIAATKGVITARRDMRIVSTTQLGPGGMFQLGNLDTGRYGFAIDGREGVAVYGQYVQAYRESGWGDHKPLKALLCANEDRSMIQQLMSSTPQGEYWQGGMVIPREEIGDAVAQGAGFIRDVDGVVRGRIVIPDEQELRAADEMDVWFIRNGQSAGIGRTGESGVFEIDGLEAGYYSMVATGKHGFLAMGVQVTTAAIDPVVLLGGSPSQMTSTTAVVTAFVTPIPQQDLQGQQIAGGPDGGPASPLVGPGAPGGFSGGGGGAGGGAGGVGALLGAGIGAAIGWAIADDDVVSPPGP